MSLDAMNVDPGNEGPGELTLLRERVDRLEREVAELRAGGMVPAHRSRDETVTKMGQGVAPPPVSSSLNPPPSGLSVPPPRVSLESRLGSQIFNRVAIVALLIGTAYGLKLAIDNGLLGPVARVVIGLGAGAGLVLWSERFRRQGVLAFSYSLKAVGTGVLYLSLWAAFQLFHLLPGWAALTAMLLVTAWNAFMAWSQDAELLAGYALIGGFLTPVLLSTGGNHEVFLFTYMLALDAAAVALIRLKHWPRLLLGTFPATVVYFIGWYSEWYRAAALDATALFLLLFWAVFAAASLGGKDEPRRDEALQSVLLPLGAAGFLALGLYSVLQDAGHHDWLAWVMLALAAMYLGLMRLPQRRTVSAVHLSLAVVLLTIAIPLKASGRWIAVAWLVEGLALFWASTGMDLDGEPREPWHATAVLRWLSAGALGLGFVAVWALGYWFSAWMPGAIFGRDVGTALVGVAAFGGVAWIAAGLGRSGRQSEAMAALIAVDLLALLLCVREVAASRTGRPVSAFAHADLGSAVLGMAVLAGVAFAAARSMRREPEHVPWRQLGGGSVIALNAVAVLSGVREIAGLWGHGLGAPGDRLQEALAISAFLMLYSAMLLAVGFWRRAAMVRWQGLALLVFTIGKTFLYDIASLRQGYRVASLLGLGGLLMGVSFAYQKDWLGLKETQAKPEQP